MRLLAVALVLLASSAHALTQAQVQQRADDVLTPLFTDTWRPAQQAYFVQHQLFAQCLTTHSSVPVNDDIDPTVNETVPDLANVAPPGLRSPHSCHDVLGGTISTAKPYTLYVDVCEGPSPTSYDDPLSPGRTLTSTYGFRMTVFFEHAGVVYERSQSYGVDSVGAGAARGCYGGTSTGWLVSAPGAPRTGETGSGSGVILDGAVPQAAAVAVNCHTGQTYTADGAGAFSAAGIPIGRNTFLFRNAASTRQRVVTRDVRSGSIFSGLTVNLNAAFSGCP